MLQHNLSCIFGFNDVFFEKGFTLLILKAYGVSHTKTKSFTLLGSPAYKESTVLEHDREQKAETSTGYT
jgi:hypothetical protein